MLSTMFSTNFIKNLRQVITGLGYTFFAFVKFINKKLVTSIEIIFYIILFYLDKIFTILTSNLKDKPTELETKSFLFVIFFSFFFYYFIVIELSILLFGYSLLCYRFLFILILSCFLAAWKLETAFLKSWMSEISTDTMWNWINFYKNETPLTFYDFIHDYKTRPLFRNIIVEKYRTDIYDGRVLYSTFFLFLIFFYMYSAGYKFDPRFVNFAAKYFWPVVNFFQSWANPRLEDFSSALIRFRNRVFGFFEYKYDTHTVIHDKLKELTLASPRLEDWAHSQWGYKTSLWKTVRFNDIYFLRAILPQYHLWRLVFDLEQPIISASWFDPNWKLLFTRYVAQEFNTTKTTFWKRYFNNDNLFWDLIKDYKKEINRVADSANSLTKHSYVANNNYTSNTLESMLAENYFNKDFFDSQPLFENYGTNRDYYNNIIENKWIKKIKNVEVAKEFFTTTAYINFPYTITGLWDYHKKNKENSKSTWFYDNFKNDSFLGQGLSIAQNSINSWNYKDFFSSIRNDINFSLYNFYTTENFESMSPHLIKTFFTRPLYSNQLEILLNTYNYRLCALENGVGLSEWSFGKKFNEDFNLDYMINLINKRINWIKNAVDNEGFLPFLANHLITYSDISYYFRKFFKLSNFIEKRSIKDIYRENDILIRTPAPTPKEPKKEKKKLIKISSSEIDNFMIMESELRGLENLLNLWSITKKINPEVLSNNNVFSNSITPWYIRTLKYFGVGDYKFVMPGFVGYYYPTPYPTAFSTFGKFWNKYQFWQRSWNSIIVGYSDSLAEMWNSTPIALYSGVEAILYFKPLLDFFDYFIRLFVRFINYIIEILITQELITPITSLLSLAIFAHLIWFIHFYIYSFIFFYLLYYFYVFYYWKIGFLWFYERLFQENFLMSYTDRSFWHPVTEIWYNYWTPEQFLILSLQTNLLLHFSFFNYNNFFFVRKKNIYSLLNIYSLFLPKQDNYFDFLNFQKNFDFNSSKTLVRNENFIFHSFYIAYIRKYQMLLFEGGYDVSVDHLVWSYFEYLNQTNLIISWSLWKNIYFTKNSNKFISIIKQFTILISSQATTQNFLFLATPLLDSFLLWKIMLKLFNSFKFQFKNSSLELKKNLLFVELNNCLPLNYVLFLNYKIDFYNFFINSGLDIYSIIKNKEFFFLTKLNSATFWDDTKYWILAFFWSFWFVPKIWFPHINLNLSYEDTRLHLSRLAYANSWIAQSMVVWPHYNIVQHLWWTSRFYSWSFGLVNSNINLNNSGLSVVDNVRNYLEKRYTYENTTKTETLFGIITSLNLKPTFIDEKYGEIPYENKNFDLSFPSNLIDWRTTSWGYLKTNPPLNLYEIGITPLLLINLFWNYPLSLLKIYFTFFNQLDIVTKHFDKKFRNLNEDFGIVDTLEDIKLNKNDNIYAKYEFYFKQFDYLFWYSENKIESNFIFTFDISFFFNHFCTWDYFSTDLSGLRSKHFNPTKFLVTSETNNKFLSNLDMIAKAESYDYWLQKPFGVLDRSELHSFLKFKNVKLLDTGSFSWYRDDPFLNLDTEHTLTEIGLSVYPKEDKKNLATAYSEEFSGSRNNRFPYNTTLTWNQIGFLLVGWVGELFSNTIDSTSMIYSILYASPEYGVNSWNQPNALKFHDIIEGGKWNKFFSFFAWNNSQKQLLARSFGWLNLMLSANSYRYSFGPKASSRFDFWSWKCGFLIDYWNGLYLYWPYLGFRHSFFSRLVSYDNLYGFYKTYRQNHDSPLVLDLSTDVIQYFTEDNDITLEEDDRSSLYSLTKEELDIFLIPYREVYYSFHHPYFVGYLYFWMLIFTSQNYYLGLSNFSFKRLLLRDFLLKSSYTDTLNFDTIANNRNKVENWFWKSMFKYRIYYSNPSFLTSVLDCILDEDILTPMEELNTMHKFFLFNCFLFKFLNISWQYNYSDIRFLLDYKKIYNYNFLINWLTLDNPFATNPYLVVNNYNNINVELILNIFKKQSFNYSHWTSLREPYNFNLFFDWSSGTYLDLFNLSSYMSTTRGSMSLPDIFFSNPTFIGASFIKYQWDESKSFANDLRFRQHNFAISDVLISSDYALHNLSILNFFQESLSFIFDFNVWFYEKKNFFYFLDFYFRSSFLNDVNKYKSVSTATIDSKILKSFKSNFYQIWTLIFLYWIQKNLSHDLLCLLLDNGLFFSDWKHLSVYFKSFKFWIFNKYSQTQFFYKKIGLFISKFLFRNG